MRKFIVGAQGSLGATFLEWSIHYLANQDRYYHCDSRSNILLPRNPISGSNAHRHLKNHPKGFAEALACFEALESRDCALVSFYPYRLDGTDHGDEDYIKIYQTAQQRQWQTIYVKTDRFSLYCLPGRETSAVTREQRIESQISHWQEISESYFKINTQQWATNEIWDWREQIALNIDPQQNCRTVAVWPWVDHTVDFFDLCCGAEHVISDIVTQLGFYIWPERLQAWQHVYHQWKSLQLPRLWLDLNIDHAARCIVNDWNFGLPELDLFQEAMIQRWLMQKHGMNLKTWGITQFPNNTKKLHQLLELNQHS